MGADSLLVDKLKAQRDRFIAFAFAGADVLLEMDADGTIGFCTGAGEALYGLSDNDMIGRPLAEFVYPRDRKRFDDCLLRLKNTSRLDHTPFTLMGAAGTVTRMRLAGIRLPHLPNTFHLVLSRVPPMASIEVERISGEVDHKGLFIEMVRSRLNEANRVGTDYTLTLFDLSGSNLAALDSKAAQSFLSTYIAPWKNARSTAPLPVLWAEPRSGWFMTTRCRWRKSASGFPRLPAALPTRPRERPSKCARPPWRWKIRPCRTKTSPRRWATSSTVSSRTAASFP